jgi:phage replication O-like protein O
MAGFTKVENVLLEKVLTANLSKRHLKIILLIIRFSFGCQKEYALLKNKDFSYAKVSPSCIKYELLKLVEKGVIKWNSNKGMVWINKNLNEWRVGNLVDNSGTFAKMVTRNLPKQQFRIHQNSDFGFNKTAISFGRKPVLDKKKQPPKENIKESINKDKENTLLNIFKNYFLKVSPLEKDEALILKDIIGKYNPEVIEKAITVVSSGNEKSFSHFLKVLDDLAIKNGRQAIRLTGFESMKSILKRLNNS